MKRRPSLSTIQELIFEPPPTEPDSETKQERDWLDLEEKRAHLKDLEQNIILRRRFAWSLFFLLIFWLLFVDTVIVFVGFGFWNFELSEKVLIALITSTTINVIGLFAIVIRNLFPSNKYTRGSK